MATERGESESKMKSVWKRERGESECKKNEYERGGSENIMKSV